MTIQYANGAILEAVLLSRTETTMLAAVPDREDSLELNEIHGVWVADDCEPVDVQFSWSRYRNAPEVTEADCTCPQDLAVRLIQMLYSGSEVAPAAPAPLGGTMASAVAPPVV